MKLMKVNLGKVSITVHGDWEDIDYDRLTLVYHKESNAAYISKRPVPMGTNIDDTKYWTKIIDGNSINNDYNPTIDDDISITETIGNIQSGLKLSDIRGWSYDKIIELLLIKEIYPNIPKHFISFNEPTAVVEIGSNVIYPSFDARWNNELEESTKDNTVYATLSLKYGNTSLVKSSFANNEELSGDWGKSITFTNHGEYKFEMEYQYGTGIYELTSNLGNKQIGYVSSKTDSIIHEVQVTYPWYIDNNSQDLVAIGEGATVIYTTSKSPKIKVPFENSTITVEADIALNGNYNPVANWIENEEELNGITYKVYYGEDSFSEPVPHKITIKIVEDDGI